LLPRSQLKSLLMIETYTENMVFSPLHWIPSALAAFLILSFAVDPFRKQHKTLSAAAVLLGILGLVGYISAGSFRFLPIDFHTFHVWIGFSALSISVFLFIDKFFFHMIEPEMHCLLGKLAAILATVALFVGVLMLLGLVPTQTIATSSTNTQELTSGHLSETEAVEYHGTKLVPLSRQGNNAIKGTQRINKETYRLYVTGLIEHELNLTYSQILELPAYSELVYMPCVEGWGFNAKWTGFRVTDLLNLTGLKPGANYVLFTSADGYTTSLPLDYLQKSNILVAYGINDRTLPQDRGFPLQLVAKGKYGYKWAKWITKIEVTNIDARGYWETRGYSNSAYIGEPPFEL
jgi:DMSO/TMAO reductase YedYZ molybdopterin-dependent catalytic subunit